MNFFLGIDVGTGSARVGIFDERGVLFGYAVEEIQTWKPRANFVEQSSENIWQSICSCCNKALDETGIDIATIKGIGCLLYTSPSPRDA